MIAGARAVGAIATRVATVHHGEGAEQESDRQPPAESEAMEGRDCGTHCICIIGERYGVSGHTIRRVLRGTHWIEP